jgi:uncharacterized protein
VENYLLEEIKAEGLARNFPAFAKFLDSVGYSNGELINYINIAQDCGVDAKTVKEYFQILEDTLLGSTLMPYKDRKKRSDVISTPKFYLFDVGVAGSLMKRKVTGLRGVSAGDAFEHFIYMELLAYRGVNDLDYELSFWRTQSGLEVDFVLGKVQVAVEVKVKPNVRAADIKGLIEFKCQYPDSKAVVVCTCDESRIMEVRGGHEIEIISWKTFLELLWKNQYLHE